MQSEQFNQSLQMVICLFEDWKRMYGAKLKDRQNLDLRTAELWTVVLKKQKVTLKEFTKAHEESICLEWPPTSADDFIKLARKPIASNYPDSHTAFTFACQNEGKTADIKAAYEHVVIYETVRRMGSYALKNASSSDFKTWDKVYQVVCQEHSNGAVFTIPESRRLETVKQSASDDVVNDVLAKAKAMLAGVGV